MGEAKRRREAGPVTVPQNIRDDIAKVARSVSRYGSQT
jgi:hypothetical protein